MEQRKYAVASDERMMDAKYHNRKFKLVSFCKMFLVKNYLRLYSSVFEEYIMFVVCIKFSKIKLSLQGQIIN